jgi:hypothetical protein
VDVHLHSFPFLSSSLTGTAYFEMPDRYAVIFDTVPLLANSLKKVYPQLEPPSAWGTLYEVTQTDEDATSAQFRLVRRKNGRIDHVSVSVDQQTATVTSMAYFYKDGGSITFSQQYDQIDGLFVIKSQTGKVDIPRYSADLSSTFEHYQLNRPIDEKVFADS